MRKTELGDYKLEDTMIAAVVDQFYARVHHDHLGPFFIGDLTNWDERLQILANFWSLVMLRSGRYKGSPVAAHLRHAGVIAPMFDRWLSLWSEVTFELLPAEAARAMHNRAGMIAQSLKLASLFRLPSSPPAAAQA